MANSYGEAGRVVTNYFTSKEYTVTEYDCAGVVTTDYWKPATQLLYPPSFSISLAHATASLATSNNPLSASASTHTSTSAPSPQSHQTGSSLSNGAQIGIGVGVGGAVGLVLVCGIFFYCWRRNKKSKEQVPEVQESKVPYSPPTSYDQSQYYRQSASPSWSPHADNYFAGYPSGNDPTATRHLVEANS